MISVKPLSNKAKNRFANLMDSCEHCIVEQHTGNSVFLTSLNRKYHFWVAISNDQHWQLEM